MAHLDDDLRTLARSVAHADDIESFVRPILKLVNRCSGLESVFLTLIDHAQQVQRVWFAENTSTLEIEEGLAVAWEDTLCKRALAEGRYLTTDVSRCWNDSIAAQRTGIQTFASVPIHLVDNQLIGTLCGASQQRFAASDDIVELLHLCSELIAVQLSRKEQVLHAEKRAETAEARLNKVQIATRISRLCLEAVSLQGILAAVAELLNQDPSWARIDAFRVGEHALESLNGATPHSVELAGQILEHDYDALQLIVRNQEEPLVWADPEEQILGLVITSDTSVEALLLVHLTEDLSHCQDSLHLLQSTANALSVLASRLADHSRLEAANQVLEHHALHDVLTGLPNRRYLIEMLDDKLTEGEQLEIPVYIAFIDLDGFKYLNDTYGHDFGDAFLKTFAARLTNILRGHDLVARYGGDEFVFVGLGSPNDRFEGVRELLLGRIRDATRGVYRINGQSIQYAGPSIGIIEWQPGEPRDVDVLLRQADAEMYVDKQKRREPVSLNY